MSLDKNHVIHRSIMIALISVLALGLMSCGGDDDSPTDPAGGGGGGGNPTAFDQTTAITQAQVAAPQAVSLVESMTVLAGGLSKANDGDYGWNPDAERWEWHYVYSAEGINYDWTYYVQYLDGDGNAQQSAMDAVTINHEMMGVGTYHLEQDGSTFHQDYEYTYNTSITGMGSATLVMTGNGSWDISFDYQSPEGNYANDYEVSWQTLAPGISVPASGGCPVGTIRYDFDPYYSEVVFNGTATATSTLYDSNDNVVPGGGDTHALSCGPLK